MRFSCFISKVFVNEIAFISTRWEFWIITWSDLFYCSQVELMSNNFIRFVLIIIEQEILFIMWYFLKKITKVSIVVFILINNFVQRSDRIFSKTMLWQVILWLSFMKNNEVFENNCFLIDANINDEEESVSKQNSIVFSFDKYVNVNKLI
jgi:hypothetical protein